MPEASPYDWFRPRLAKLLEDAASAGIAHDVAIAVVTDLINGPDFNAAPLAAADEDWNKDIGEPDHAPVSHEPDIDAPAEHIPLSNWIDDSLRRF